MQYPCDGKGNSFISLAGHVGNNPWYSIEMKNKRKKHRFRLAKRRQIRMSLSAVDIL